MNHKHAGVVKSHDVNVNHKDIATKTAHQEAVNAALKARVPKVIYQPITHADQIIVKFDRQQLTDIMNELERSGAPAIGVAVIPFRR